MLKHKKLHIAKQWLLAIERQKLNFALDDQCLRKPLSSMLKHEQFGALDVELYKVGFGKSGDVIKTGCFDLLCVSDVEVATRIGSTDAFKKIDHRRIGFQERAASGIARDIKRRKATIPQKIGKTRDWQSGGLEFSSL